MVFFSPFKYIRLRNEGGTLLFFRDFVPMIVLVFIFAMPFIVFEQVNFSRASGFVDRIGSISSVLSGFYIAALVAVASFAASIGDMDEEIKVGKIYQSKNSKESLTRREYVCAIFGFLAFLSLTISIISAFALIVAPVITDSVDSNKLTFGSIEIQLLWWLRTVCVVLYCTLFSMMIVTTFYGLYYLTDRIYAKSPEILPKQKSPESTDEASQDKR